MQPFATREGLIRELKLKNRTMKKLALLLFIAFLSTTSFAQQKENRNVDDFSYISFGVNGDLTIIQGSKTELVLVGDEDVLENIETSVSGGKLKIRSKSNSWSWGNSDKVYVTVTVKDFTGVSVSGSGDAINKGTLKGDDVDLSVSGSGKIELALQAKSIDCSISGSGKIELSGSGKSGELSISGSGEMDAADFEIETMSIRISGSGDATVFATKEIDSRISGSGTIRYKGDPDKISNHSSGSGKLRKM